MKHLKKITSAVQKSLTDKKKTDSLNRAFKIFSTETGRLEAAYHSLTAHSKMLNLELQQTNQELQNKAKELDITTDYLKGILDHIAQGILVVDLSGTVTTYNTAAENILGIKSSNVVFHSFWQTFKDDLFGFSLHELLKTKKNFTGSCITYTTPQAFHLDIEVTTTFIFKRNHYKRDLEISPPYKIAEGLIIMLRDVTEVRHLQVLANRTDQMKELGEIAAHVAHEIRNPLGGIKGFASLLKRDLAENPKLQKMANYIVEGTENLNQLVSQILQYARPIQPHFEKVNLIQLLNEMKNHLLADINMNTPSIQISIQSFSEDIPLFLDPPLFKSALLNLLMNAKQAMPNGGRIDLSVYQKHNHLILVIADSGIGISEENLSKLWSPFFTTKPEGNGLGLAEVQKVIQAHRGTVDVSSAINQGTTFIIKIPFTQR